MGENWRELISQPEFGIQEERNIWVTMRDGVRLSVNVFRPDAPAKFPALLSMSGYGKEEQELLLPPQPLSKSAVWDGNIEAGDTTEVVPRGYVHVIGDVRGIGSSEGEYFGGTPIREAEDAHDVVEWMAEQPWCDGNVGMLGYSYYGMIQLKTAIQQPPHLKAIFPSHLSEDQYRDMAYNGGIVSLFLYGIWDGRHGTSGFAPRNAVSEMMKTLPKEEFERRRQELLNHPDIKHYPNLYHLLHYPYKNPWFVDILMNPYDGPYWQERSIYSYYDRIKVPTYVVGKLGVGSSYWDIYNGIKAPKKLLVKPTGPEERPWREDIQEIIRWYDHWLKGNDTGMMDEPPIKMFVMGINKWRYEKEWPLPGIKYTPCYLQRWEGLSFEEPELYQYEPDCFLQQPLHLSNKRDSVVYMSPPMSEDLEVIGPVAIKFYASIDQDDTNWIVSLSDVAETGSAIGVGRGMLKASHRALDPDKSKPEAPYHPHTRSEPVIPGEINEYAMGLGVVSNVFRAGHRIKLEIQSLISPRDPEIQIHYHPPLNSSKTTLHKIYRDREHQSHLILPVIPGKQGI